jgi:hypothetical protein
LFSRRSRKKGWRFSRFTEPTKNTVPRIDAEGRGKPIGEQVLADAHGWDDESNRANHPD